MVANVICILVGALLVVIALNDIFQSVVVPRATGRRYRPSYYWWRTAWIVWPKLAWRMYASDDDRREDFLAIFAPMMLILLIALWLAMLIVGYALALWGLRSGITPAVRSFDDALYFSGTSLLTIGFGDIVARSSAPRMISILAAISGLTLLSITTAYIFLLFGSFQARESFVVLIGARAGAPTSGVNLLAIAGYSGTRSSLTNLMMEAQGWTARLMETHLAYPVLAYFRSSHDYESWIGTLGTLLDAAILIMTTVEDPQCGEAHIFYNIGRHATADLYRYFRFTGANESVGIERSEFENACDRLAAAGYTIRNRDESWARFSGLRSTYAGQLNIMARFFEIPPLRWIGDRSTLAHPHNV
jgi:hypothetical protein